ncbi:unnamed protein product [Chrysodeixis includens]|uniref:Uncharacterized protein n=1 Tax=Chrysodeixis includens TaxID=689277 RepID=A0A9N8KUU4_CHRIL|nr:unnamed protein product [Chrysodeixis includens]
MRQRSHITTNCNSAQRGYGRRTGARLAPPPPAAACDTARGPRAPCARCARLLIEEQVTRALLLKYTADRSRAGGRALEPAACLPPAPSPVPRAPRRTSLTHAPWTMRQQGTQLVTACSSSGGTHRSMLLLTFAAGAGAGSSVLCFTAQTRIGNGVQRAAAMPSVRGEG